ncbi:unnamed protein product [Cochlearia groenlandica]
MEFGWRNDVGLSKRETSDEHGLINGYDDYFDKDQTNIHLQIVPEMHNYKEEDEYSKKKDYLVVPDEHSETGDHHHHHHINDDSSDSSYDSFYLRNKHEKRRRIHVYSDEEESEGFTREVPSMTRQSSKKRKRRRRRDDVMIMSNKMRTLQQLVPNCHKTDEVSVLDKAIEYMKNLQLQLHVMSIMGMNPYMIPPPLNLLTAMAMTHVLNPSNQTMPSPLNWPLQPPFANISFPPHSYNYNQSLFPTRASSPQCLCDLVPCCVPKFP